MNKSIRIVSIFSFLLIIILLINFTYIQVFQEDRWAHNPKNMRQFYEMKSEKRGQINAGGQILAESKQSDSGYYERYYTTNPEAYAHVEGYVSDRYGAAGLEASQNSILNGTDSSLATQRIWDQITGKEVSGANIELTIRPNVQKVAYNQLADNGYTGAVVALKPSTGEILAMASTPSYDPNSIVNSDPAVAEENFNSLVNDDSSPFLNRATQQTQPPGSTFKLITTAAALEKGETADSMVTGARTITLPDTVTTLENYNGSSCGSGGSVTLRQAFAQSCNTAFVDLVGRYDADTFRSVSKRFGIDTEITDLGIPVTVSTVGEIPDRAALAQSAIGQRDVRLTPLNNAIIAATIANGGTRMEPHLIRSITGTDLRTIKTIEPTVAEQSISEDIANQLTDLMKSAESYAGGPSYIASKTGTAEHGVDSRNSRPHAWYVAFGTGNEADVAVAVLVENGGNRGQEATGGSVAAPIGRAVIDAAIQEAK